MRKLNDSWYVLIPRSYLETNPNFNADQNKYYDCEINEVVPENEN